MILINAHSSDESAPHYYYPCDPRKFYEDISEVFNHIITTGLCLTD